MAWTQDKEDDEVASGDEVIGVMLTDSVAFNGYHSPVKMEFHEDGRVTWKPLFVRHRAK